ncbi:hypothetical protein M758_4G088600 [Ceratodon purpureus]|uniref:Uncharacterized protein n=1 Tax=Ceratodon purpureus TaxID=3225 RepID=A0A8T0I874_CERPU|nr:hypothetical protein KC19_4G087600 [Ceratodon purpureus]KAG0618731.1 hypothetical protein M758_4G088600 [Ceratodon purpureus]
MAEPGATLSTREAFQSLRSPGCLRAFFCESRIGTKFRTFFSTGVLEVVDRVGFPLDLGYRHLLYDCASVQCMG